MPLGLANKARACIWCAATRGFDNERSLALHPHHPGRGIHAGFRGALREFDLQTRRGWTIRLRRGAEGAAHVLRFENDAGFHLRETPLSKDQQVHDQEDGWMKKFPRR